MIDFLIYAADVTAEPILSKSNHFFLLMSFWVLYGFVIFPDNKMLRAWFRAFGRHLPYLDSNFFNIKKEIVHVCMVAVYIYLLLGAEFAIIIMGLEEINRSFLVTLTTLVSLAFLVLYGAYKLLIKTLVGKQENINGHA